MTVAEARARLKRAIKNTLNDEDRAALSTAHQRFKTSAEAAKYDLDKAIQRDREARAKVKADRKQHQVSLFESGLIPATGEDSAIAVNDSLRGHLFSPTVKRGRRKYVMDLLVTQWGENTTMTYSGAELDQADFDVLLAVTRAHQRESETGNVLEVRTADGQIVSSRVYCSARGLLRDMGRATGGKDHKWLKQALHRLGGSITLRGPGLWVSGSIVPKAAIDENTDRMFFDLDHNYIRMLAAGYTLLDWDCRLTLPSPFAKWLHGYVCSNLATAVNPHCQTTRGLMERCGSAQARDREFRERTLRPALDALVSEGVLVDYWIDGHRGQLGQDVTGAGWGGAPLWITCPIGHGMGCAQGTGWDARRARDGMRTIKQRFKTVL